jgi:hypothetical protein
MRTNHKTAQLGELVVAAFDEAAQYSTDSPEVSRLATRAVMHMLRRARKASPPQSIHLQQHAPRRWPSRHDHRAGALAHPRDTFVLDTHLALKSPDGRIPSGH